MVKRKNSKGTHTAVDLDVVASFYLDEDYGGVDPEQTVVIFLRGGDESLDSVNIEGLTLIDRGRGPLDHHGRQKLNSRETSASLVAKKLGVAEDKYVHQLVGLVERKDLQGISLPFDVADIVSCIQKTRELRELNDEEKLKLGIRITRAAMEFRKRGLTRDNQLCQEIIVDFLEERKSMKVPEKFQQYFDKLENPKFERPFDLVEILLGEKAQHGEEEAVRLVKTLLDIVFNDSVKFYLAEKEFREAEMKIAIGNILIVAHGTNNEKFNPAARAGGASIIIQRDSAGLTQISFNTGNPDINDELTNRLAAMIRMEECLVQGRTIPDFDLGSSEWVCEIPEWYYYKAPALGNKKPGRFIMNGSLTAPDVPPSKISLETLFYIAQCAVRYHPNFNWQRWMAERITYYLNNKN